MPTAEAMVAGYDQFVGNIPFYGFAVLCIDHPAVQAMIPRVKRRLDIAPLIPVIEPGMRGAGASRMGGLSVDRFAELGEAGSEIVNTVPAISVSCTALEARSR